MLKHTFTYLLAAILPIGFASCGGDDDNGGDNIPSSVQTNPAGLAFEATGGSKTFTVSSASEWDAVCSDSWVSITKEGTLSTKGTVEVTVAPNSARKERAATITVLSGTARASVSITQEAKAPEPVDPTIEVPEGYEMVWNDEFDGTALNASDWRHEVQGLSLIHI